MTWIKSDARLARHTSTLRLARNLEITVNEAIGIVHRLLWHSVDFPNGGGITPLYGNDVADIVGWDGGARDLAYALADAGLADIHSDDDGDLPLVKITPITWQAED